MLVRFFDLFRCTIIYYLVLNIQKLTSLCKFKFTEKNLVKHFLCTLESGIDVGQGINVGPGKLGKKNKRRALNTHVLCSE